MLPREISDDDRAKVAVELYAGVQRRLLARAGLPADVADSMIGAQIESPEWQCAMRRDPCEAMAEALARAAMTTLRIQEIARGMHVS